jgi:hypothetical protein
MGNSVTMFTQSFRKIRQFLNILLKEDTYPVAHMYSLVGENRFKTIETLSGRVHWL